MLTPVIVQSLSCIQLFKTAWTTAFQAPPSSTISWSLLKFMSTESVVLPNHLILCYTLLLLPSIFPSIRVFSNESNAFPMLFASGGQSIRGSASASVLPMNSVLISFRIDWFDFLAVQGTLKSLLQHHNSKALVLQCSAFFIVQLSHPYMTIGKSIALTRWTFVDNVMSLLFSMLSRFVIAFLPRSKHLLISWLQSLSMVILGSKKRKSVTVSIIPPSICDEVMGPDAMILVF